MQTGRTEFLDFCWVGHPNGAGIQEETCGDAKLGKYAGGNQVVMKSVIAAECQIGLVDVPCFDALNRLGMGDEAVLFGKVEQQGSEGLLFITENMMDVYELNAWSG